MFSLFKSILSFLCPNIGSTTKLLRKTASATRGDDEPSPAVDSKNYQANAISSRLMDYEKREERASFFSVDLSPVGRACPSNRFLLLVLSSNFSPLADRSDLIAAPLSRTTSPGGTSHRPAHCCGRRNQHQEVIFALSCYTKSHEMALLHVKFGPSQDSRAGPTGRPGGGHRCILLTWPGDFAAAAFIRRLCLHACRLTMSLLFHLHFFAVVR